MKTLNKRLHKKIMAGLCLALAAGSGMYAQTSSYDANTIPVNGVNNAAFGAFSMYFSTAGATENVGFGNSTLGFNTANNNSAVGHAALGSNNTGYDNTAMGNRAMLNNTTGYGNSVFGSNALYTNQAGVYNVAVGYQSMYNTNSANSNVAVGSYAMYNNITGGSNTALGYLSLYKNTASSNSAFGHSSLYSNTTGRFNTGAGQGAVGFNRTGSYNTGLGYNALDNNLYGNRNTALGANADVTNQSDSNATAVGYGALVSTSNKVRIGNTSVAVIEGQVAYSFPSDARFKYNVNDNDVKGLEFIKLLRPVVYNFDGRKFTEFLTKNLPDSVKRKYLAGDFETAAKVRQSGFLAQEVEEAAKKSGYDFNGLHKPETDNDNYSIAYSQFVVPLVKGMQEQQKMIEDQQQQMADQNKKIEDLQNLVNTLLNDKTGSATGINEAGGSPAQGFAMGQNIPNPFSNETVIKYTLPQTVSSAAMNIYDLTGKQISSLPLTQKGDASVTLTSEKLAAGIYIYSIVADGKVMDSKRMIVSAK